MCCGRCTMVHHPDPAVCFPGSEGLNGHSRQRGAHNPGVHAGVGVWRRDVRRVWRHPSLVPQHPSVPTLPAHARAHGHRHTGSHLCRQRNGPVPGRNGSTVDPILPLLRFVVPPRRGPPMPQPTPTCSSAWQTACVQVTAGRRVHTTVAAAANAWQVHALAAHWWCACSSWWRGCSSFRAC